MEKTYQLGRWNGCPLWTRQVIKALINSFVLCNEATQVAIKLLSHGLWSQQISYRLLLHQLIHWQALPSIYFLEHLIHGFVRELSEAELFCLFIDSVNFSFQNTLKINMTPVVANKSIDSLSLTYFPDMQIMLRYSHAQWDLRYHPHHLPNRAIVFVNIKNIPMVMSFNNLLKLLDPV